MVKKLTVGMQVHFLGEILDEGIEAAIGTMIEKGGINTLMLLTNIDHIATHGWGSLTHNPRGRQALTASGFTYEPHLEFYSKTKIKPMKSQDEELKDENVLPEIIDVAKAHGMETYAFMLNRFPGFNDHPDCHVIDVLGRQVRGVYCHNNPDVRNLYFGMVEDLLRSYDFDGIFLDLFDHSVQYGFRILTDEMADSFGITSLPKPEMGLTCFCEHCVDKAEAQGIDVGEIRKGLLRGVSLGYIPEMVEKLSRADEVFRLLTDIPEYMDWLRLGIRSHAELHAEIYNLAKKIDGENKVALDIYSVRDSWKYAVDWKMMADACDWIKPMFYSGSYPGTTFSPDRVYEGTLDAIGETRHKVSIVPGINACMSGPDVVGKSVTRAMSAGADGVVISWDYALIRLDAMDAARKAIEKFT